MNAAGVSQPTHVLMLSWEYPPNIVGGLAIHVAGLGRALVRRSDLRVTVLTRGGHGNRIWCGKTGWRSCGSAATLAVVPSSYELFGLVALEAMAWGVPLVASDVGGLREFTEGAAVLVPPADAGALAQALLRVLSDVRLRQDLARRGIERARDYTWDRCAERTAAVYGDLSRAQTAALAVGADPWPTPAHQQSLSAPTGSAQKKGD